MFRLVFSVLVLSLLIACGGSSGNVSKSGKDVPSWDYRSTASVDSTYLYGFAYTVGEDSADARKKVQAVAQANLQTGFDDYLEEIRLRLLSETSDETLNSMQFLTWYRMISFSAESPSFDVYYPKSAGPQAPTKAYARVAVKLETVHEQIKAAFQKSRYKSMFASTNVAAGMK